MPELLAAIRPDDQSFALLLHLVGATVVFGALLASATSLALARGRDPIASARLLLAPARRPPRPDPDAARRANGSTGSRAGTTFQTRSTSPPGSGSASSSPTGAGCSSSLALALGGVGIHRLRSREGRRRAAQGDDGHLAHPHRRLRRRGVGDDRQAELVPANRESILCCSGARLTRFMHAVHRGHECGQRGLDGEGDRDHQVSVDCAHPAP